MNAWLIPVVLLLVGTAPIRVDAAALSPKPVQTYTSTLADLGLTNGIILNSRESQATVTFPIPTGVPVLEGVVVLHYTALPLGLPPASMIVSIQDTPRTAVPVRTSPSTPVVLSLTQSDLAKPAVTVTVRATALHQDQEICTDEARPVGDLHILPTSKVILALPAIAPASIRTFWELLPRDVTLSARPASPAEPMPQDAFILAWALGSLLLREGRTLNVAQLPTPGQFLIASAEDIGRLQPTLQPTGAEPHRRASVWVALGVPEFSALVFTPPYVFSTIAPIAQPWRPLLIADYLDAPQVPVKPLKGLPVGRSVPLAALGLAETWRSMAPTAQWEFAVGPTQLPAPLRPKALHVQLVVAPSLSTTPALFSLYINEVLVQVVRLKETGDPQAVAFALPERYLRRANTFKLVAQRDSHRKICEARYTQVPIQLLPGSTLEVAAETSTPTTFTALSARLGQEVNMYLPRSALTQPFRLLAFLSRLSADFHIFPDQGNVVFYESGERFQPTGPFLLLGHPEDPPTAPVQFTRGRIVVVDPDSTPILDIALDSGLAVVQIAHSQGHPGLWIHAKNIQELPLPPSLWLEDGDVAVFTNQGRVFKMASTFADPVAISYPDDTWWATWANYRYYVFFLAWLVFTGFMIYLFRVTRRQEAGASTPTKPPEP